MEYTVIMRNRGLILAPASAEGSMTRPIVRR